MRKSQWWFLFDMKEPSIYMLMDSISIEKLWPNKLQVNHNRQKIYQIIPRLVFIRRVKYRKNSIVYSKVACAENNQKDSFSQTLTAWTILIIAAKNVDWMDFMLYIIILNCHCQMQTLISLIIFENQSKRDLIELCLLNWISGNGY